MKLVYSFISILSLAIFSGCSAPPVIEQPHTQAVQTPEPPPVIAHGQSLSCCKLESAYLSFVITYEMPLKDERLLRIRAISRPWLGNDITFTDELRQKNERWVLFDCDNIADRILIPGLPEEIAPYCKSIHKQANIFWKTHNYKPDEFIDGGGTHWKQVK